ncbi:SDR family NAD(P)-dependent oxidoreductase [Novosphingobium sp.]|uniref:SDR family NAD(P)-dependent oxidoreductase n=1 Tax=Novosphingobium sp. TaxID=1874826 RepID=UPI003B522863
MTKTVLITGATAGFGAAAARRFVAGGWQIIGTGRRAERLAALTEELGADRFHAAAFDIRDAAAIDAALAALPPAFAGVDCLINNAGLALGTGPAQTSSLNEWQTMIDTNVTALATMTHRILPLLVERRGAVINLSSVAASYPYPGGNIYGGTKAFVRQFSLGLRSDLIGTGVRVCSIEPGMCESEFTLVRTGGDQAAYDKLYQGAHPLQSEDIADTLFWVATQPPHVNINSIELMPVNQAFGPFLVHRDAN